MLSGVILPGKTEKPVTRVTGDLLPAEQLIRGLAEQVYQYGDSLKAEAIKSVSAPDAVIPASIASLSGRLEQIAGEVGSQGRGMDKIAQMVLQALEAKQGVAAVLAELSAGLDKSHGQLEAKIKRYQQDAGANAGDLKTALDTLIRQSDQIKRLAEQIATSANADLEIIPVRGKNGLVERYRVKKA